MNKALLALATALAATAAASALAQRDFSTVEIRTTKLADTVYMLEGAGGNIGVSAGEDSVFVIDDQFAPLVPKIQAAIAKVASKPVQFVLNTHWHFDHTGGNEAFGRAGAIIVAHENVRRRMTSEQFIEFMKRKEPAAPKAALPVVTFTGTLSFHLNGEEIRVVHLPHAHTDGDSIVHFTGSDVLHMGDIFFNRMYPFIDYSSGGSIEGVVAACDRALAMVGGQTKVIPGHGPLATVAELRAYRDMLAAVAARVRKALDEGRSDEEIAKSGPTADFDAEWGKGFMKPEPFARLLAAGMRKAGR